MALVLALWVACSGCSDKILAPIIPSVPQSIPILPVTVVHEDGWQGVNRCSGDYLAVLAALLGIIEEAIGLELILEWPPRREINVCISQDTDVYCEGSYGPLAGCTQPYTGDTIFVAVGNRKQVYPLLAHELILALTQADALALPKDAELEVINHRFYSPLLKAGVEKIEKL